MDPSLALLVIFWSLWEIPIETFETARRKVDLLRIVAPLCTVSLKRITNTSDKMAFTYMAFRIVL